MAEELGQRNFTLGVNSFALIPLPNLPRCPWPNGRSLGRFGAAANVVLLCLADEWVGQTNGTTRGTGSCH